MPVPKAPPFAGPHKVLDYLGRYTQRVALSNERILAIDGDQVLLRYRDRAAGDTVKTVLLSGEQFIGRFLLHVLPDRFVHIRHYGFLSNRAKAKALPRCRTHLGESAQPPATPPKTTRQWILELTGIDIQCCPICRQPTLEVVARLPPEQTLGPGVPNIRAPPVAAHGVSDTCNALPSVP